MPSEQSILPHLSNWDLRLWKEVHAQPMDGKSEQQDVEGGDDMHLPSLFVDLGPLLIRPIKMMQLKEM
jgi:hypothetical protein